MTCRECCQIPSFVCLSIDLALGCETYGALGVDVADISGNAGGTANVVEGELSDAGVELEEERQRLSDSTAGTEDGNLGELLEMSCQRMRSR